MTSRQGRSSPWQGEPTPGSTPRRRSLTSTSMTSPSRTCDVGQPTTSQTSCSAEPTACSVATATSSSRVYRRPRPASTRASPPSREATSSGSRTDSRRRIPSSGTEPPSSPAPSTPR
ncbi:hypothetical protein ACFPRL_25245 [Pseudoclavibacter helvolus]